MRLALTLLLAIVCGGTVLPAQTPTPADRLRGAYGRYRANNDLLSYDLRVRVDPARKSIRGTNTIRFRMLRSDTRIQLDLYADLHVDAIRFRGRPIQYERRYNAVFLDFPETLESGRVYSVDFAYSGTPAQTGRFGGISFGTDPAGRPWITTACEDVGASVWWPNKDQWRDEVEHMTLSVDVPDGLVDVSNGRFQGKIDLGDGYTRWRWAVHYPINNYDVALNIGDYKHFADRLGGLTLDFYALPEDLAKAKRQFTQAKTTLEAFEHYFGPYPFEQDGYKLIEVPYAGMEHQTAVAYGNGFENGYLGRDWTGVGISLKFDFIIVHETAHEWWGNAVSAADVSDMWIHEGWATYMECLYVEYRFGHADEVRYVNSLKPKVENEQPIITERGIQRQPPEDMYFKGALLLNTLRSVVNDDAEWWKLIHDAFRRFEYRNILTEDLVRFFNARTGMNLTPIFNQYLRHARIPTLELRFDRNARTVAYRWRADEPDFAMPVRVGQPSHWQILRPTTSWQTMATPLSPSDFKVATDMYYVNVEKRVGD